MMKRIYLAGPVTGRHYRKVYQDFSDAKQFLLDQGFDEIVNPCELVAPGTAWPDAMLILLPYLSTCNFMALLPDYQRSNGAMCEYYFARGMENEGLLHGIIHIDMEKSKPELYSVETKSLQLAI
ncbi:MAG: DUF4406 domain-containing protein [Bacteroidales bacterium]